MNWNKFLPCILLTTVLGACSGKGEQTNVEPTALCLTDSLLRIVSVDTLSLIHIFPTLSSSTIPMIRAAAETTEKMMAEPNSPVLGLHLEGHYFNMAMAGGQIPENIKDPDPEEYIPLLEETHCIKRWDAAPELPGAMQFGKYITAKGVLASVGHTQAEFEDIQTAYEAGYTPVSYTHLTFLCVDAFKNTPDSGLF